MTEWNQWVQSEKEALAEVMERHGIEWEQKGTHEKHLSVLDFEKKQRAEEVEQLNAEIESAKSDLKAVEKQLNQTVPKLKSAEKLAADFPEDVDKILPEAGALESAKNYREKRAKPVLDKAVRLIKSLHHSLLDLRSENSNLKSKAISLEKENSALKAEVGKYKHKDETSIVATLRKSQKEAEQERIRSDLSAAVQVIDRNGLRSEFETAKRLKRNEKNHGGMNAGFCLRDNRIGRS